MQIFLYLTDFIVPLVIVGIIGYGLLMKIPVYDTFIKGARSGFLTVICELCKKVTLNAIMDSKMS